MAALRVCDFDMLRRRVNVSRSVTESGGLVWSTPKTWERRSVPFPAVLADELAALMVGQGPRRSGVHRPARRGAAQLQLAGTGVRAGGGEVPEGRRARSRRSLRTTCGTRRPALAVSAGANVKAVQRMLGHAKASMTLDVYADLFDEDLDERGGRAWTRRSRSRACGPLGGLPPSDPRGSTARQLTRLGYLPGVSLWS